MTVFQIEIYPQVLLANNYPSVGAAVQTARQLEKVGHSISSIRRGGELYAAGKVLRDLLGEKEISTFRNFAVISRW